MPVFKCLSVKICEFWYYQLLRFPKLSLEPQIDQNLLELFDKTWNLDWKFWFSQCKLDCWKLIEMMTFSVKSSSKLTANNCLWVTNVTIMPKVGHFLSYIGSFKHWSIFLGHPVYTGYPRKMSSFFNHVQQHGDISTGTACRNRR